MALVNADTDSSLCGWHMPYRHHTRGLICQTTVAIQLIATASGQEILYHYRLCEQLLTRFTAFGLQGFPYRRMGQGCYCQFVNLHIVSQLGRGIAMTIFQDKKRFVNIDHIRLIEKISSNHLTSAQKYILEKMASFGHEDGTSIYPSVSYIVELTNFCERTVRSTIKFLIKSGFLILIKKGNPSTNSPAEYNLNIQLIKDKQRKSTLTPGAANAPAVNIPGAGDALAIITPGAGDSVHSVLTSSKRCTSPGAGDAPKQVLTKSISNKQEQTTRGPALSGAVVASGDLKEGLVGRLVSTGLDRRVAIALFEQHGYNRVKANLEASLARSPPPDNLPAWIRSAIEKDYHGGTLSGRADNQFSPRLSRQASGKTRTLSDVLAEAVKRGGDPNERR